MKANLPGLLRPLSWLMLAAVFVISVVPPRMRPVVAEHTLEHAVVFFLTGALFGLSHRLRLAPIAIVALCYASLIETIQLYVPGRHARVSDLLIDGAAMIVGGAVGYSIRQRAAGQPLTDKT